MKKTFHALAALSVLCGAGCATTGHMPDEGMTGIAAGKGLVVFSTGASATNLVTSTSLRLVQGSSRKMYDKVVVNVDYPFKSHFPGEHGRVHTLQLPPGEYLFVPQVSNVYLVTTAAPIYRFTVGAGEATYIGNFWIADNQLTWSDAKSARDIDYFRSRNPALVSLPIVSQRAEFAMTLDRFESQGTIWGLP